MWKDGGRGAEGGRWEFGRTGLVMGDTEGRNRRRRRGRGERISVVTDRQVPPIKAIIFQCMHVSTSDISHSHG